MVTVADITGVLQSLTVVKDLVQANHSFRNFNELSGAVADVNMKLMHFLSAAIEAKEKELTLANRIGELEKEIEQLKNWERERERYQLTEIAAGMFAYRLKPGMENGEPPHNLCANCFTKGEKSILQSRDSGVKIYTYVCPRCEREFPVASRPMTVKVVRG